MDTVQEMVKQQVKAIKVRKHVLALRDQVSKVVRCLYTEDFRREASNVSELNRFEDGAEVTPAALLASGAISRLGDGVKLLGNGEVTKKVTVKVNAVSETAKSKIEAAGGTVEVI